jgi:hypothetical protein
MPPSAESTSSKQQTPCSYPGSCILMNTYRRLWCFGQSAWHVHILAVAPRPVHVLPGGLHCTIGCCQHQRHQYTACCCVVHVQFLLLPKEPNGATSSPLDHAAQQLQYNQGRLLGMLPSTLKSFCCMRCRYVQDLPQLRKYGACVHLLQEPPAAVIVDDLAHLLANTRCARLRVSGCRVTPRKQQQMLHTLQA